MLFSGDEPAGLTAELALLVRRTALSTFPREHVAALAGPAWLAFLDRTNGGHEFSQGPGRILETAPYRRGPTATEQLGRPIDLVRRWIKKCCAIVFA